MCLSASAIGSGRWTQSASGPSGRRPSTRTGCPGLPTTVEFGGTSWMTTVLAPIFAPWPIVIGPSSFAPEPIVTLSCTVGWRLPVSKPVPPSVTPWYIVTLSPTSAVSPITTPIPWSMNRPSPICAAGWISIPVSARETYAIARGAAGTPAASSACATRCASSACRPGQPVRISSVETPVAAGSRSRTACTSRRNSPDTRRIELRPTSARRLLHRSPGSPDAFSRGRWSSRRWRGRPAGTRPRAAACAPVRNFSASSACSEPITPAAGPRTPASAHERASSGSVGNAQR